MNFTSLVPDDDQGTGKKGWSRSQFGAAQDDDMGYSAAMGNNAPPASTGAPAKQPVPNGAPATDVQAPKIPRQEAMPAGTAAPQPDMSVGQVDPIQETQGLAPQLKSSDSNVTYQPRTPIEEMQAASQASAGLGPRPSNLQDLPPDQRHHGFRKALDIASAIGMGAYTMNPLAGAGVYRLMSQAPLRRAQGSYDERLAAAQGRFKNAEELEKQNIGEEKVTNLNEKIAGLEEERTAKANKLNETFVAGSEMQSDSSPTGWVAQTAAGDYKPYTPKKGKPTLAETNQDREAEAKRLNLKGDDYKYYVANGKLREPGTNIHIPSAEKEEFDAWSKAYTSEHGHAPDSAAIEAYKHGIRGGSANQHTFKDAAAIDKYSDAWYAKERKAILDEKAKVKSLNPDAAGNDVTLQAEYAKIESAYQEKAKQFESQKKNWYASVQGGKPVQVEEPEGGVPTAVGGGAPAAPAQAAPAAPTPGPAPTPSPTKTAGIPEPIASVRTPPGGYKVGDPVQMNGQTLYVTGIDPKNGRPMLGLQKPGTPPPSAPPQVQPPSAPGPTPGPAAAPPRPAAAAPTPQAPPPAAVGKPSPGQPQQGPPVGGGYFMGQQVTVDGKPAYVTGFNARTGKPRVSKTPPRS